MPRERLFTSLLLDKLKDYQLPRFDDLLDKLRNAKCMTHLDLLYT